MDDTSEMLKPDANVTVTVTTARHPHVLSIPHEALRFEGAQPYVFRVVNNKLVRTNVQTNIINTNQAEIVSGLSRRDRCAQPNHAGRTQQ